MLRRELIGHLLGAAGIVRVQVHRGRGERGVPNRFITRHSRHEEIPLPSSPRLPISGVEGRHFDGVAGSPR